MRSDEYHKPGENRKHVARLLAKGHTVREIADALGITQQRVYQIKRLLGETTETATS